MHGRLQILPLIIWSVLLGLTFYLSTAIEVVAIGFKAFASYSTWGMFGLSTLSLVIIARAGNRLSKSIRNFFFAFIFINLLALIVADIFVLLDDLKRLVYIILQVTPVFRSGWIIQLGLFLSLLPVVLFGLGMLIGPYRYRVIRTDINLPNLPTSFEGLKIVQISDIHSGSFYNKKAVKRGVDLINKQNADVIIFTGDLVNDDASEMDDYIELFSQLKAPLGVFSILGNHDYGDYVKWPNKEAKIANFRALKEVHGKMGWRLLLDEHVYLERGDEKIALIGVENWGKGFHQIGDLEKAYAGTEATVKLLLSHDPTHWDEQVKKFYKDIAVTFSGHTHGAQMGFEIGKFRWSPIKLRYKKWAGLYKENNQYLYINRGFGFLGYPGRLGIWPEISLIRLKNTESV